MLSTEITTPDALRHLSAAESGSGHDLDRRRFLQLVGMGVGAGVVAGTGGSLLDELLLGHDPSAWAAGPIGPTDGILVVIGMFGGNDGLNTVVPFGNGHYYDMHGSLAIPAANTLQIAPNRGLHPELTELKRFWDDGELAIVEGVGYPDPDLSHFNSMAFWMAGRPHVIPTSGWLGRWLDGHLAGSKDLYTAAEIGHSVPLHMIGTEQRATVVPPNRPGYGADQSPRYQRQYEAIREMRDGAADGWAELVGDAFVDQLDLAKTLAPVFPAEGSLPDDELTAQLEVAARLINANLGFRVLTAGYGDFDSHAGQPQQHPVRMSELNVAVRRFFEVLEPVWGSRVTVMTFSEFGRTPWDNDGLGTDHGTSAPHFVFGKNVRGGFYGQHPSLAGLGRWDRLEHHVDFRSYYASIIDGWLGGGSSDVLGGEFENLGLFANAPGYSGGGIVPGPASPTPPSRIVPVTPVRVVDTRRGLGAPRRPIGPGQTIRAKVTGVAGLPASGVTAVIANVTAVAPTSRMHFKVFPGGTASPATSNLNSTPARNVPNLVAMAVSPDGHIEVMNSDGDTHCLVDVLGYATTEDEGAGFVPVMPQRLFDTRRGVGVRSGPLPSGSAVEIQVAGRAGVPIGGATAVIVNLAAVDPASQGNLRVQPSGSPRVGTSNVNYRPGETAPNLVLCEIGPSGSILVEASSACHAIGDVFGFVASGGDLLVATPPRRVLDTRRGLGAPQATVGPERHIDLAVTGVSGVPETATAVVLNVTATNVTAKSHVRVWPAGSGEPTTSNLNLASGVTRANLVVCQVGENGIVSLWNPIAECDLIADVFGYFAPDGETLV